MIDTDKNISDGNLTQKEIIQLLLHNAQHMATREEVKADILRVEDKIINLVTKEELSKVETSLKADISKVETSLKADILRVETSLKVDISKVDAKFDKIQWLIIATMMSVFLKDYIFSLFN